MYKIGLSTCGDKPIDMAGLQAMRDAGIDAVELCMSDYGGVNFRRIRADADAAGMEIFSVHSPKLREYDISSTDREYNDRALKEFCRIIDEMSKIEVDKIVVHPTHTPEPFEREERGEKIKRAMECLDILAEYADRRGVLIAVENLPRTCLANTMDEYLYILSANDKLRSCFDLNHALKDDAADSIRRLGSKIITVHVSDRDNINERHWLPGEGILDWRRIIDAFNDIGYDGVWMYEVGLAASSTIRRRLLTYGDFVINANEIFDKKELTVIGTPVSNLGIWGPE